MATLGLSPGRGAVSDLKAPGLKPERRQAQLGGRLAHKSRGLDRRRAMVSAKHGESLGAGDVRCARALRGSGDSDELPGGFHDDGLRMRGIVPAPNGARYLEVPADAPLWQEFRSAVSTEQLNRLSANRKRPRSIFGGFQSIRGAICGALGAAESSTRHRHAGGRIAKP